MSDVKKCDRCKRFFEYGRNEPLWIAQPVVIGDALATIGMGKDLCYRCSGEIERWLKDSRFVLTVNPDELTRAALRRDPDC